jgi:hypothetical protein
MFREAAAVQQQLRDIQIDCADSRLDENRAPPFDDVATSPMWQEGVM